MSDKVLEQQLAIFGVIPDKKEEVVVSKRKQREQQRDAITKDTMITLMNTIQGRNWIYNYLDDCQVFSTPFIAGKPDVTSFLSGVQSVGQKLLSDIIKHTPDKFYLMNEEAGIRKLTYG